MRSRALNDLRIARLERLPKRLPEGFPSVLRDAIWACVRIVTRREEFPALGSGQGQQRLLFGERGRERHLRRLEAICLALQVLLAHCKLVDLRVGRRRRDGSCDALRTYSARAIRGRPAPPPDKHPTIQREAGLGRNALCRALRDLRDSGWLTSKQPSEEYQDEETSATRWRAWPAIHSLTPACFQALGVDLERLEQQRGEAAERRRVGPDPVDDVPARRARQRVIRAQLSAAKRAARRHPSEAEAAAAIRELEDRVGRRPA